MVFKSHLIIKVMMSHGLQIPVWTSLSRPSNTYDCRLLLTGLPTISTKVVYIYRWLNTPKQI